ncbi:MAG: DUF2459 domain-containing protein [Prochloraceae cyanobacterium]
MKIKKIFSVSLYFFSGMGTIFFLMLLLSIIPRKWQNKTSEKSCYATICIADNGFHTDILLPEENENLNYKYLGYGWGDRTFFMKKPERYSPIEHLIITFKALFLPTPTAMRVSRYSRLPSRVKCVKIGERDYLELKKYIESSFKLSPNGTKILLEKEPGDRNVFYGAKGTYTALYTCNSWTAAALRKADLNTPVWGGFSFSIAIHLQTNCREKY